MLPLLIRTIVLSILGVTVDFPYKPYPCQIAMLGRIIKALQQSKHCLLESPTGTGKTLTLLCAALAWQQKEMEQIRMPPLNDNKDNSTESSTTKPTPISRIFYCTRTHKQLEQVAKQLSNTVYKDKIRMTLLSSRDNYCVHPVVSKGPNKNHECAKITRQDQRKFGQQGVKNECGYYERLRGKVASDFVRPSGAKQLPRVFDIEQFTEYCQTTHGVCPYYTSRLLINDVQVILCPYNYLIDPRVRNSMQMSINNSVIIIDEGKNSFILFYLRLFFFFLLAHNIEDCARESMKFQMRKYDFDVALDEIRMNQKALEMAQIQTAQLIVNESGFSSTQQPISSTQLTSTQQQSARRVAGFSEYDQLNEEIDLLEHLNIDQLGNNQEQISNSIQELNSDDQEVANSLKLLAERFSRIILWFDTKDPREKYAFTPKELIEQFHRAKFIDRSIITVHKPATYVEL
jgi:Rad3-related DNA helicase